MTYYYYYYGHLRPLVEVGYLDRHQVELLAARLHLVRVRVRGRGRGRLEGKG